MCTVSFVPQPSGTFILTSNRDEEPLRQTIPPERYTINGVDLVFPKDEVAGGTWIGASCTNRIVCLLNGGFKAHKRKESYRMSRGIIVIELLTTTRIDEIVGYNFEDIEPFTIILVDWNRELKLHELIWDGSNVYFSEKPISPTIWSSSLLYTKKIKRKRELWFSKFMSSAANPTVEEVFQFHKTAGDGNPRTNIIMDRGYVQTKSITQIVKNKRTTMRYDDLQKNETTVLTL